MLGRLTLHFRAGVLCLLSVILPTSSGLSVRAAEAASPRNAKAAEKPSSHPSQPNEDRSKDQGEISGADVCGHRDRPRTERQDTGVQGQSGARSGAGVIGDFDFGLTVCPIEGALIVIGGNASDPREGLWAMGPPSLAVAR
jgi:hypothetical protein